jgi:hypothetical protein
MNGNAAGVIHSHQLELNQAQSYGEMKQSHLIKMDHSKFGFLHGIPLNHNYPAILIQLSVRNNLDPDSDVSDPMTSTDAGITRLMNAGPHNAPN